MTATMERPPSKRYVDADFAEIISGKVPLPNFEEMDLSRGVAAIAAGGGLHAVPGVQNAKVPGSNSSWGHWTRYFLGTGQGGGFDGTGYVLFYDSKGGYGIGRAGRFAICVHEKVEGPGANHRRGWHPGWCAKCGIDMSVDSGD